MVPGLYSTDPQNPPTGCTISSSPDCEHEIQALLTKYEKHMLFSDVLHAKYLAFFREAELAIAPGFQSKSLVGIKYPAHGKSEIHPPAGSNNFRRLVKDKHGVVKFEACYSACTQDVLHTIASTLSTKQHKGIHKNLEFLRSKYYGILLMKCILAIKLIKAPSNRG